MKKHFLLTFLMAFVGIFTVQATSVVIDVDNANNVIVQTNSGYGTTLSLENGMNRFDLSEETDNPILIKAAPGAEIVSITKDGTTALTPGGDGNYRVSFAASNGIMVKIETSGNGGGGDVAKDVTIDFFASGEGISGKPFKVFYEKDSQWVAPETGTMNYLVIPEKANVKIVPDNAYEVTGCSVPNSSVTLDGSVQADGSYVFVNTVPDYYRVKVDLKLKDSAISFSITVDYAANLSCYLEYQRDGSGWDELTLYNNVKTSFVIGELQNPLEFVPSPGAEIVQILKNGEAQKPIGWNGSNGWVFEVENGDNFVVTTKGAPTEIVFEAPDGQAALESYFFRRADGSEIALSGKTDSYTGYLGETIYVSGRPGTSLAYLVGFNGGFTNMLDNLMVVKGADGENPAKYLIYGTRNVNGVVLNVDDASRVKAVMEGGRGDELQLQSGKNEFPFANIKNAIAFSATDGNQMVSVTVNGDNVNVSSNGYYMVEAAEGDWIEVKSRKNPIDAVLEFSFNDGADITWLQAVSEGIPVELTNPMTVKSYTRLVFSAADGYVLESMQCATAGVMVLPQPDGKSYEVNIATADVTKAEFEVVMKEMQPSEGNSIVIANGDEILVRFWEMTERDGSLSETFVKKLDNNRVNEVKTGNWIRVYCNDTQSEFAYVKVNGTEVELVRNSEGMARTAWVQANGRTVIDTHVVTPCRAKTNPTYDDRKHIVAGNVYVEVDGQKYTDVIVYAGQTVKLVAEPETGYVFDHFEKFYALTMAADGIVLEGDTYTFTEADARENFILFKGVFKEDENQKVYVLRGSTAWLVDSDGNPVTDTSSAMGTVLFRLGDGSLVPETTALEGQSVRLEISVATQEIADNYEVYGFCLMSGFPNAKIPANYEVKAADADTDDVIWINGLMRAKGLGVGELVADGALAYDAETMTLTAPTGIAVYNVSGRLVVSTDEPTLSTAALPRGVYVAVSGGNTIKFVK
ncbi:MAG: hypothetical protein K2G24_05165 [Muribaculaceae bacterium]|nr:hypothetical protein [Muribaculaceae bacterium]